VSLAVEGGRGDVAGVDDWFEAEAPGIIEGLERSGSVGASTAAAARLLVGEGASASALRLVLEEAMGSGATPDRQ
jgi:hypothetical protein